MSIPYAPYACFVKQARKFVSTQDREIWTVQDTNFKLENEH